MKYILGRCGSGKTTLCLEQINKEIQNGFDKPIIYIVPEQFSFESEKELIKTTGKNGIIGAQVLSFKRLAYKIFTENNINIKSISNSSKSMLLFFIMLKRENDLLLFKNVLKNIGIINTVADEISEFKRYNLSPSDLLDKDFKNEYLNMKIHDLAIIYEEYENRIKESYLDANDELTILAEVIRVKDKYLNGAKIWIDEFDGFIPQEVQIIKELSKKCEVTISVSSGEDDIFNLNNKVLTMFRNNVEINSSNFDKYKEDEFINLDKIQRFNNEELKHMEKSIFRSSFEPYQDEVHNIFLNQYSNLHEEVETVSKEILNFVRNKGLRYDNIAILTRDIDKYKNLFKMIFPLYDIPYFFDDKKELSLEPAISLVLSLIDIISNNYRYEDVFSYLKTGLINFEDSSDIDILENYVLKWGIKGKKWEDDFTIEDVNLEKINNTRKQIVTPIMNFKQQFNGRKTVSDILKALFHFIEEIGAYDNIKNQVEELYSKNDARLIRKAQEMAQVWNMLVGIFDEMNDCIGDELISFDKFKTIFKLGVSNYKISVIPTVKDKVIIGDIERTRNANIKVLFIVGVNEGSFPKAFQSEGFINDKEREILLGNGIEIAKDTTKLLEQEYFNIYKAFCVPTDYLHISYPISDLEGNTLRKALIINQIKSIFPKIKENKLDSIIVSKNASFGDTLKKIREEKDNNIALNEWNAIAKWYEEHDNSRFTSSLQGLNYLNTIEFQSKEVSKKLYGDDLYTSVSRLESYVMCPFSYYLRYGLRLKDREVYKLDIPDIGSFLHEIIEIFSKKVLEEDIDLRTIEKSYCDSLVDEISNQVLIDFRHNLFESTGKLRNLAIKLKEQVKKTIWLIVIHIRSGSFNIMGSEVEFGVNKEYPEILVELSDGSKLVLTGKVDRVDVAKLEDGSYIRIIDYKSSNKAIKLSNVYYGIQLQLLSYINALSNDTNKPAGVLYLKLDDPICKVDKRVSKEDVENSIIKSLRMNGLIISNANLISAMDNKFDTDISSTGYESDIINLKRSKDGVYSKMPVISQDDFKKLQLHMNKTLKKIGDEIYTGNVKNEPLIKKNVTSPCDYCAYSKTCMFDKDLGNKVRVFNELKDEEVLSKIRKE